MAARKRAVTTKYTASDEIIRWIESITGLLTYIESEYGGIPELVEHPRWDDSRNKYAASLLSGLKRDISRASQELNEHVNNYEKVLR